MKKKIVTYISWKKEAKETSNYIIEEIKKIPKINTIELHARGRLIMRAVDVLEILKRELNIDEANIITATEEIDGLNISKISISLTKK